MIFVERLNEAPRVGIITEVLVNKSIDRSDGSWIPNSGEIYGYTSPNPPVLPHWGRVDLFKHLEVRPVPPLSTLEIGAITVMGAHILKLQLEDFMRQGLVEELPAQKT